MKEILIVCSQHGDELLGEQLYDYMAINHKYLLNYVDFTLANPAAHELGKRYLDTDMNRSYYRGDAGYEAKQAKHLLEKIDDGDYRLVLDMHTTTAEQAPCFITARMTPVITGFIAATAIDNIVLMEHEIVKHSLIGVCDKAVSIEVARHDVNDQVLEELAGSILFNIAGVHLERSRRVFPVADLLTQVLADQSASLANFELSDKGYYPVLIGEKAYDTSTGYIGFMALTSEEITL